MRALLACLLVLGVGCGGASRLVEIPPLDEEVDRVEGTDPDAVAAPAPYPATTSPWRSWSSCRARAPWSRCG